MSRKIVLDGSAQTKGKIDKAPIGLSVQIEVPGNMSFCSLSVAKDIMRVAYLLAAVDGVVLPEEKAQFARVCKLLFKGAFYSPAVVSFIGEMIEEGRQLVELKSFYPHEDEYLMAFRAKAASSMDSLMQDRMTLKRGFATWVSICCSDKDFSQIERKAIRILLEMFRDHVGCRAGMLNYLRADRSDCQEPIGNDFIEEIEKRLLQIQAIEDNIRKATSEEEAENFLDEFKYRMKSMDDFIKRS